jgi:cytochrome c556
MKQKSIYMSVGLMLGAVCALPCAAQQKPEVLVKQRQSAMVLMGKYFGPVRAMGQGKTPYDAQVVTRNAGYIDTLSKMPWDGFTPATKDAKSAATPAVFADTAKFKEAQERFTGEVAKLADISKKGDEAAVKSQILAVDKACGGCHENFRERQ